MKTKTVDCVPKCLGCIENVILREPLRCRECEWQNACIGYASYLQKSWDEFLQLLEQEGEE